MKSVTTKVASLMSYFKINFNESGLSDHPLLQNMILTAEQLAQKSPKAALVDFERINVVYRGLKLVKKPLKEIDKLLRGCIEDEDLYAFIVGGGGQCIPLEIMMMIYFNLQSILSNGEMGHFATAPENKNIWEKVSDNEYSYTMWQAYGLSVSQNHSEMQVGPKFRGLRIGGDDFSDVPEKEVMQFTTLPVPVDIHGDPLPKDEELWSSVIKNRALEGFELLPKFESPIVVHAKLSVKKTDSLDLPLQIEFQEFSIFLKSDQIFCSSKLFNPFSKSESWTPLDSLARRRLDLLNITKITREGFLIQEDNWLEKNRFISDKLTYIEKSEVGDQESYWFMRWVYYMLGYTDTDSSTKDDLEYLDSTPVFTPSVQTQVESKSKVSDSTFEPSSQTKSLGFPSS